MDRSTKPFMETRKEVIKMKKALSSEAQEKLFAEDIWLNYLNRYLFECGTISEREYLKMTEKIAERKAKLSCKTKHI